jgi:hypothetical protein
MVNDLADYLEANGIGMVGTTLFIDQLPLEVNDCFALMNSISPEPNKSIPYYVQYVDVWARYASYQTGYDIIQSIFDLLHQKEHYEFGNYHIYLSYSVSMIQNLENDAQKRHIFRLPLGFVYRKISA